MVLCSGTNRVPHDEVCLDDGMSCPVCVALGEIEGLESRIEGLKEELAYKET